MAARASNLLTILAVLLVLPFASMAQTKYVAPRINGPVDEGTLTTLRGNTHPLARPEFDQGAAPSDLALDRMLLVLTRSPEQESALKDLLDEQQDKSSDNYHKWLTPDEFGERFGPDDQDIQAITSWLVSHGFQSVQVSRGRTVIEFSGTATQLEGAFHASIHRYAINGEQHWANANDPQIPSALAPVVAGVFTLPNFLSKPQVHILGGPTPAVAGSGPKSDFTSSSGAHALTPADVATIYNANPVYASTNPGGNPITGNPGSWIAILARSNIQLEDVYDFRSIFGVQGVIPALVVALNGPDPGDRHDQFYGQRGRL
jgi:subtilase family serine protease